MFDFQRNIKVDLNLIMYLRDDVLVTKSIEAKSMMCIVVLSIDHTPINGYDRTN